MMATAEPPDSSSFLPLLESLEDSAAGHSEHTDAYLTIANRLSGEEGRQFLPAIEKHFSRLGKTILAHITNSNVELSQAALQALGFCVYHSHVVSGVPEAFSVEILSALCSLVVKSTDKNTCTRALWVISKQSFPPDVVAKKVSPILATLENVWSREDIQSVVMEHEALNVIIRMLEQVPAQMGNAAVRWGKLVVPLVVHSASKVRLRAAAAMEIGMPLLLEKQTEMAAVIEPMMSTKLIPELQKLFTSKNETNVLKLWPLFVKLLGKLLHRGGPFINSLLHLEELGFRSSSPTVKKIAFIAWKSLIDNFSLNPDILCSAKRMKLLMQPLMSIHVRTEALMLTKVEVWWYLVVQLGPNLSSNFDQVSVPLLHCTIGNDSSSVPGTPSRAITQNGAVTPGTPKTGIPGFNSSCNTPRMNLNSSVQLPTTFPSIQLLGLEMILHYLLGPEAVAVAAKRKLTLTLEPLNHPLLSGASSFTKHAAVLFSNIRDGFNNVGKDAPDSLLAVTWMSLVRYVNLTIESGSKKDRQGCDVLTLMFQALQSIVTSETLPADRVLILVEATVKGIPQRVLGSASYQVGKMDVLNGTPALFLILLLYNSSMLSSYIEDERFFQCFQTLVGCGLSGHTSPLAFVEAVLGAVGSSAGSLQSKEHLWRMWSVIVAPLTDTITQSNEVNQGDALEHNFSAMHSALLFPVTHLLHGTPLQQAAQKSMLSAWSKLYKVFARCSALVVTAEENICCEELCAKVAASVDKDALMVPSTLNALVSILQVMVECVDFSPYSPQFQQKLKSPHTPGNWMRKRNKALGNLSTFQSLLVQCLEVYLEGPKASSEATGVALLAIMSALFTNLVLANAVQEALSSLVPPLSSFYTHAANEPPEFTSQVLAKLEKLFGEVLGCVQNRSTLAFNDELLALLSPLLCVLFPHKNKQLRTSVTQFWNSTFAKSVGLTYPAELRPILSQVKQKTPIILPGFEIVAVSDELSGQYSSESSQLETKLSGIPISSVGKRDSLLGKATELKDRSSIKTSKPVSTKLDFGSPKPPRRDVLEEEASIDFVFIPPETKERVLTEHQKEVKRTKRGDIPAMYNNLDASLDTTAFTQYTQSQDNSLDKLPTEKADIIIKEAPGKVLQENMRNEDEVLTKETQDYASPKEAGNEEENQPEEEIITESANVSTDEDAKSSDRPENTDILLAEGPSPNIPGSYDLVSGTPQKPNSRRQSFITLEKYAEGKPASPSSASMFTGRLIKTPNSQEHSKTKQTPPDQDSQSTETKTPFQPSVNSATESPRRPKDSGINTEPVKLTERLPSDTTDEDVIPDTQDGVEDKDNTKRISTSEETQPSSQEEELDDSQSSMSQTSPDEPRRSGRQKIRPLLPGEDSDEREKKRLVKRRRSGQEPKGDSPKSSSVQGRVTRRSLQVAEEEGSMERLRTRAQREKSETRQTNPQGRAHKKIKLYSRSDDTLHKHEPTRRRTRERESSQTDLQSDGESQSQGRRGRRSKASLGTDEEGSVKKKEKNERRQSSQASSQELELVKQMEKNDNELKDCSHVVTSPPQTGDGLQPFDSVDMIPLSSKTAGQSQEFEGIEKMEESSDKPEIDSDILTSSQTAGQSQDFELVENTKKEDSLVASPLTNNNSQDGPNTTNLSEDKSEVKHKTREVADDSHSQEDSEVSTPSASDSQGRRRSRRSKASSEAAEVDDKHSLGRQTRSNSKTAVDPAEASIRGRTRRSKGHEEFSKSSPSSTPESSESLDIPEESSQGRGRYLRRRSITSMESLESESSDVIESSPMAKKRGRKPRRSLPSPLTRESKEITINDLAQDVAESQELDTQCFEAETVREETVEEAQHNQDVQNSETLKVTVDTENQPKKDSPMEAEVCDVVPLEPVASVTTEIEAQMDSGTKTDNASQEGDTGDMVTPEAVDIGNEPMEETLPSDPCDAAVPHDEATEKPQISEPSDKKADEVSETEDGLDENQKAESERLVLPEESTQDENPILCPNISDVLSEEDEKSSSNQLAEEQTIPLPEDDNTSKTQLVKCQDEEQQTQNTKSENDPVVHLDAALSGLSDAPLSTNSPSQDVCQYSPVKQNDLEAVMGSDVGQSPCSGRTRGTWSPSASPSTSILKKGQKRPLEEDSPSPLVKSRRVSFANPIQQQETADDIDRRSPAIRTSSPRRSRVTGIPQPKYITTPTKSLLILSPRNLRSPGSKSSKKCLISEMSQEPRPVPRDCIYPALVGCSTPVEAVLPQISSNMWSRGFGQLVRARNIKTVGDLSALTPTEIKTLPIRSPKISNVKKALKIYEQQRKGRGGEELKSLDELEMMTSELEESCAPQNQDEEKTAGETLATELVDEPLQRDEMSHQDDTLAGEHQQQPPEEQLHPDGLTSDLQALSCRMTPLELSRCSPQQLVQMHDELGGMMRRVVVELQTRLYQTDGKT